MILDKSHEIIRDPYNFILLTKTISKPGINPNTGKPTPGGNENITKSFYPTLEQACLAYIRKATITDDITSVLATIKESTNNCITACKKLSEDCKSEKTKHENVESSS